MAKKVNDLCGMLTLTQTLYLKLISLGSLWAPPFFCSKLFIGLHTTPHQQLEQLPQIILLHPPNVQPSHFTYNKLSLFHWFIYICPFKSVSIWTMYCWNKLNFPPQAVMFAIPETMSQSQKFKVSNGSQQMFYNILTWLIIGNNFYRPVCPNWLFTELFGAQESRSLTLG
jgi:hypothetical protein